ncbi:MAG: ABC transporter ATP-binding protein [[Ruminococcus] gnavus]|nr:ABC transporter ATP-binding protein [Mediterraneibacter gnavus]
MKEELILETRDVWYSYEENDRFSLQGLDLKVKKGSKVAFMGANGCGKSTFFLCCNGILRPQKGSILFHGQPLRYQRKELLSLRAKVGIVFQDPDKQLFSASVEQEISFGILNLGASKEEARCAVDQVIEELEITPFRKRPVHALSGGQKKQVSIADILVMNPEMIILDEPAAALDPKHTRMVNGMVDQLTRQGITVLMATHDIDYAYAWADEIVLMKEGRVLCQESPQEVCQKTELLTETNLEEPAVLRLFRRLEKRGVIHEAEQVPRTWSELERLLE